MYGHNSFGVTHGDARHVFSQEHDGSVLGSASFAVGSTSASWVLPYPVLSASYSRPMWVPGSWYGSRPVVVNGSWYESWGGGTSASFVLKVF